MAALAADVTVRICCQRCRAVYPVTFRARATRRSIDFRVDRGDLVLVRLWATSHVGPFQPVRR